VSQNSAIALETPAESPVVQAGRSRSLANFASEPIPLNGPVRKSNSLSSPYLAHASTFAGGVRHRVDEGHEAVKAVLDDAGPLRDRVDAMLRVI
jgi:hypothetical protein